MAKKYTCPPQTASGSGTFSDNLVGFQLVQGGGLTQGNFEFTNSITEKTNRDFTTGVFSNPINLEGLGIDDTNQAKAIFENNFKVYPNFDLSQITNFTMYGSMVKRISASIENIINNFPAAIESLTYGNDFVSGNTAVNIEYNQIADQTKFDLPLSRIKNPFDIDFSVNATRNLSLREVQVSPLRNLTTGTTSYSLYIDDDGYSLVRIIPSEYLTQGYLTVYVEGNPFNNQNVVSSNFIIRPNDFQVNKVYSEVFDEVEKFLLNRNISPMYTAVFTVPMMADNGDYYNENKKLTWPLLGLWNLDIISPTFNNYLTELNEISQNFDGYKTDLISRFLTTGAFNEFDTTGQKVQKVLQLYGRNFDQVKKFIDALAYMNSVNYNVGNDIPSQLLKNLAQTLGWDIKMSPITNDELLSSVFGQKNGEKSQFLGENTTKTPDELNHQFYRNIVLNSAYLFKSKGTRKSVEILMKLIGAPEALVDFNEYVYLADNKIDMNQFNVQFASISGGTYLQELPVYDPTYTFNIFGQTFSGYTTQSIYSDVNISVDEYPIDEYGYPKMPTPSDDYFFEMGSGWFEQTPSHRANEQIDITNSVFTGQNPSYQTTLKPYVYGEDYLNRYRSLPYTDLGFRLTKMVDNNKSWGVDEVNLRKNIDAGYNAKYFVEDDRLVLNVKNIDLFLNPGQGILYDIWHMSREYNYPIPNEGLKNDIPQTIRYGSGPFTIEYPSRGGIDWTEINPQPKVNTFFEFAQSFWKNTINVRNRQFVSGGNTGGYPTLSSIFWRYLESENLVGIQNNNFNYQNMMEYIDGMGDYWVRLVEQMFPASTLWNTGVRYENTLFHRQKFVWRRQEGCQIVPVACPPCELTASIYTYDCPIQAVECSVFPWDNIPSVNSFGGMLGYVLTQYLISEGRSMIEFNLNALTTKWYVDIRIDNVNVVLDEFFNGVGFSNPSLSSPSENDWKIALMNSLDSLENYGYDYYLTEDDKVNIYNTICSMDDSGMGISINVGINFEILCS
jgi:hypothetical protein